MTSEAAGTSTQSRGRRAKVDQRMPGTADFVQLFEAMPHPYLVLRADPSFTIVAVNDRYLQATGTARQQIIGRGLFEVFPENPADTSVDGVSDLRASLQRVLRDRVADVMGVQKYDIPVRDGTQNFRIKYWSPVNTPVSAPDGSISYIIHHVEDVTDFVLQHGRTADASVQRVQAEVMRRANDLKDANRQIKAREAELAQLNEQLKHLDKMKTEFFANVSHEFRTPLTTILGPLESLLRERPDDLSAGIRTSLEMMYRNALRLLKLVNTLLEFSRIEAQRAAAPHWQRIDLAALTRGIASGFQSLCEQAHLRLVIDCPHAPRLVRVDPEMWERVVLNLLSNAFKFTFEGRIEVRLRFDAEAVELSVGDTGTGIPQHELPRLFERFHRIQGARGRTYEGTGIGLALVKELIGLLHGTIRVTSVEGRGSCFIVTLPLEQAGSADSTGTNIEPSREVFTPESPIARGFLEEARRWLADTAEIAATAPAPTSSGPCILVVDDNADLRNYISQLLREAGYGVKTAANGTEAWTACKGDRPALVLADVMMPVMTGTQLLQQLRGDPELHDLPVILISALSIEELNTDGTRSGADDYITKPFHVRELIARVNTVLQRDTERKRADTQLRQAAAVFTGTNEAVIITDFQRRIVAVNAAFSRITGFTSAEVMGQDPKFQSSGRHDHLFYQNLWHELDRAGYWEGEIWNHRKSGEPYPAWENISAVKDAHGQITHYVAVFSDIGRIKATEERLEHIAHHDELTGLPNRLLFAARLEQSIAHAVRHKKMVGLLMLDLDRFKLINDTLGHVTGDLLLQKVAERLKHCVRNADTVARLGGDEFAIVLDELAHAQDAALVAEKIVKTINAPILLEGKEILTSVSIGISLYPDDAAGATELLKAADAAMYRAKQKGRHGFDFYTPDLTAAAEERLALELALPPALEHGELVLYYQPLLELASGRIIGVEALLRWPRCPLGPVAPPTIIKIAEETGFIDRLGDWILGAATRQAAAWNAMGLPPRHVAINLSSQQFATNRIAPQVKAALQAATLGGWRLLLDVEITETILADVERCAIVLNQLRELGVGIAIDDFGTGYSSLSRLKSLPIDVLKIDQSFVRNIGHGAGDRAICSAIISLGHELGMRVVAEGVETSEQLEFLRQHRCDAVQGFLICKPLPAQELTPVLAAST